MTHDAHQTMNPVLALVIIAASYATLFTVLAALEHVRHQHAARSRAERERQGGGLDNGQA